MLPILRDFRLIVIMTVRDVAARYRGSLMGVFWALLLPLLMLALYSFVFSTVFQVRWGTGEESKAEFTLALFLGLIAFNFFAECMSKAPSSMQSNVTYLTKVIFPVEIIPVVVVLSATMHAAVAFFVWLLGHVVFLGSIHISALYFPLILIPFLLFTFGVTWFLASLGVYLRDLNQVIGVITTALMFLSPIFFPVKSFPENFRFLLYVNPLTPVIEQSRNALLWGVPPDLLILGFYWVVTAVFAFLGFVWFQKTKAGFADVI